MSEEGGADELPPGIGGLRVLQGFSWVTGLHVLRLVVKLSLFPLVLRYFGPEQKGLIDIALAAYFVGILLYVNVDRFQLAHIPKLMATGHLWSVRTILWQTYGVTAASQVVVSGVLLAASGPIARFYGHPELQFLVAAHAAANLVQVLQGPINRGALLAFQNYRQAVWIDVLPMAGEIVGTALVLTQHWSPTAYVFLLGLNPLFGAAYGWILYWRRHRSRLAAVPDPSQPTRPQWRRRILRFSFSVSAGISVQVVYERMGILVAAIFFPPATVAIYNLALAVLTLCWSFVALPETIFVQALSRASAAGHQAVAGMLRLACLVMLGLASLVGAALAAFSTEIALVLGGPEFSPAGPIIALFSLFPILNAPDTVRLLFLTENRPNEILKRWTSVVALEFGSYFGLQPWAGLWAFAGPHVAWRAVYSMLITLAAARQFPFLRTPRWLWNLWFPVALSAGLLPLLHLGALRLDVTLALFSPASLALKGLLWLAASLVCLAAAGLLSKDLWQRVRAAVRPGPGARA